MNNKYKKPSEDTASSKTAFLVLHKPVSELAGVGSKTAELLNKSGIYTVKDVIISFPYRYEVLMPNKHSDKGLLEGIFEHYSVIKTRHGKSILQAIFRGYSGFIAGLWMSFKGNYPANTLVKGKTYYLYGLISKYNGMNAIFHPEFIDKSDIGSIKSIYSIPVNFSSSVYKKMLSSALGIGLSHIQETLPEYIQDKYKFPTIQDSINTIHNPKTIENVKSIENRTHPAVLRFIYEELFYLQMIMQLKRKSYAIHVGISFNIDNDYLYKIKDVMPFQLTSGQRKVIVDIFNDMKSQKQMNRLIQGDVGSGKTIISFIASAVAIHNGYQTVLLAPTEVLAEQHYNNAVKFFEKLNVTVDLITGSTKKKEKGVIKDKISKGEINIIIGTHALLEENIEFYKLGLVIADEQHRFGVHQRKILIDKGLNPDIILMTATPIPRTLAMTIYGDLNVSVIDELPPGRIPCITKAYNADDIISAFKFVEEKLNLGKKAYFIYPLIDESDKLELKAATSSYEEIQKYFKNKNVGLLHGKMKADEKKELLHKFKYDNIDILVSTTVVEVGVDVPEATVILIENAERFGLSQLHQLRGRVGRNSEQSYCLLIASKKISENGKKRIKAMLDYKDGFKLAEADLELRGQGDFFGTKQSGMPVFKFADILKDLKIVNITQKDVEAVILEDYELKLEKNHIIKNTLKHLYNNSDYFGVG